MEEYENARATFEYRVYALIDKLTKSLRCIFPFGLCSLWSRSFEYIDYFEI